MYELPLGFLSVYSEAHDLLVNLDLFVVEMVAGFVRLAHLRFDLLELISAAESGLNGASFDCEIISLSFSNLSTFSANFFFERRCDLVSLVKSLGRDRGEIV